MTTQCIVVGWFGYNNLGDELMLHSLLSHLREGDLGLTVVSGDPRQTEKIHGINSISKNWSAFERLRLAENVIFGGGQIFSDNRARTIPLWSSILRMIRLLNKGSRIMLLNQGFEAKNKVLCKMLRSTLSRTNFISVRDSVSFGFVKALDLDVPLLSGPDILFALSLDREGNQLVHTDDSSVTTIGVNLRPPFWWHDQSEAERYEHVLASSLDRVIQERNAELVFVPFRLPDKEHHSDLDFSKTIISKMKNKERAEIFVCPLDNSLFSNLMHCFRQFDLFIGTALHSLILSCKLGVPFLAFPYQKKCDIFMNDIGLANLVIKPHEMLSPDLLYKRISSALDTKNEIRSLLLSKEKTLFQDSKKAHTEPLSSLREILN